MTQKNNPCTTNNTSQQQFSSNPPVSCSPAKRSLLPILVNNLLKHLPKSIEAKIRTCLHVLTEPWILPPYEYPFAGEFKSVEPRQWENLLAQVDAVSRHELQEFIRRVKNSNIFWPDGKKLCLIMRQEFSIDKFPTPGNSPELKKLRKQLSLSGGEESLLWHHGVALLPEKCKQYIKDKVIVDAGAFVGNYTIPYILNYAPKCVFAFEPNSNSTRKLLKNLKRNNIPLSACRIFNIALGESEQEVSFDAADIRMDIPGKMRTQILPLDNVDSIMKHPIGLIKADVEGMGAELLHGAFNAIEKSRPILALSCYHSAAELFGQYDFVTQQLTNYRLSFTALPPGSGFELTMLEIPSELC